MTSGDGMELIRGSGNVFRDFGHANPELEQLRARLDAQIIGVLDDRRLEVLRGGPARIEIKTSIAEGGFYLPGCRDYSGSEINRRGLKGLRKGVGSFRGCTRRVGYYIPSWDHGGARLVR